MSDYLIYTATSPSNKVYIGITSKSLKQRQKEHEYASKSNRKKRIFYSALQKYNYKVLKGKRKSTGSLTFSYIQENK